MVRHHRWDPSTPKYLVLGALWLLRLVGKRISMPLNRPRTLKMKGSTIYLNEIGSNWESFTSVKAWDFPQQIEYHRYSSHTRRSPFQYNFPSSWHTLELSDAPKSLRCAYRHWYWNLKSFFSDQHLGSWYFPKIQWVSRLSEIHNWLEAFFVFESNHKCLWKRVR